MQTIIVAAVGRNGVIGVDGKLPWHIPEDLARFKELTMGHVLVMGRATFESIGRALPGRTTFVLTRRPDWSHPSVETVGSLDDAISVAHSRGQDVIICGGAEVYREALSRADRLELTEVDLEPEGDTLFPPVDWDQWEEISRSPNQGFSFVTYQRA